MSQYNEPGIVFSEYKRTMKFRTANIGLSGIVLAEILFYLMTIWIWRFPAPKEIVIALIGSLVYLTFLGSLPLMSMLRSVNSKNPLSQKLLLFALIPYALWSVCLVCKSFTSDRGLGLSPVFVGCYILFVFLPFWLAAGFVEMKTKSNTFPATTRSTASTPVPFEEK